jgi:lysophospholipase L1-like esterase
MATAATVATFKMLALGDSVMWGQGLAEKHKFVRLVEAFLAGQGKTVELASLAHSGAIIDLAPQLPTPQTAFLFGELPRTFPSILSELSVVARSAGFAAYLQPNSFDPGSWRRTKQDLARQVEGYAAAPPDLILLDGGANDFKALQIVLPWDLHSGPGNTEAPGIAAAAESNVARVLGAVAAARSAEALALPDLHWLTEQEFKALIDTYLFQRMRGLLAAVGRTFLASRVVVTGYYPIFTPGSLAGFAANGFDPAIAALFAGPASREEQLAALAWALHPSVDRTEYSNRIVWQSKIWYEYGTERLREAVAEANSKFGDRFAVASPAFGPDNGALAPHSLLWTFTGAVDFVLQKILRLLGGAPVAAAAAPLPEAIPAVEGLGDAAGFALAYSLGAGLATDEATGPRGSAAFDYYVFSEVGRNDANATLTGGFTTSVASVGHPNPNGAKAFAAAIEPLL